MAILVANIGTSDISVKVGECYLPIGFDRNEPNLKLPESEELQSIWRQRTEQVRAMAQNELGVDLSGQNEGSWFRAISGKLWELYQQAPDVWHPRIRIGRILGVIESARQSGVSLRHIYLVVTDQPERETRGYPSDTVHTFDIIQLWLERQLPELMVGSEPKRCLTREAITFSAIDQDRLFDYYDGLFNQFDPDEVVYVSFKGGTPQMQTALKIQAIAAAVKVPIFLEPKPDVMRILQGESSECSRVAYWRYQQSQTYRSVRQLLTRWDFDGATTLLEEWSKTSKNLIDSKVKDERQKLKQHQGQVQQVLAGMEVAVDCLNLDIKAAQKAAKVFKQKDPVSFRAALDDYDLLENLYAQCKIYYQLNQIATFLARMGSFYEAAQNRLITHLHGDQYLEESERGSALLTGKFKDKRPEAWQEFLKVHQECLEAKGWEYGQFIPGRIWNHSKPLGLNRYSKGSFIKALIAAFYGNRHTQDKPKLETWEQLDFWYDRRNDIVHSSEGVSVAWVRALTLKEPTCPYDKILLVMEQIMQMLKLKVEDEVYLYGPIRHWAIAQLMAK